MTNVIEKTNIFKTKEDFKKCIQTWKQNCQERESITATMQMAYAIARGKDPRKGFSPITNPNKLYNGMTAWGAYDNALGYLASRPLSTSKHSKSETQAYLAKIIMDMLGINRDYLDEIIKKAQSIQNEQVK